VLGALACAPKERAREAIAFAGDEARLLKHKYIGTEHILLGLLLQDEGLAARVLESMSMSVERVRAQVVHIVGQGQENSPSPIPFTPSAKEVIERALREALALGDNYIQTEHVLLALAAVEGVGGRILLDLGVNAESIRAETIRMIGPNPSRYQPSVGAVSRTTAPATRKPVTPASDDIPRLLRIAANVASQDGRGVVQLHDVLIALTRDPRTARLMAKLCVDEAAARAAIEQAEASDRDG
jgi:ATP-dependent Clp protease ATP-binding subunit ClpC